MSNPHQQELEKVAAILQQALPIGEVKHIGLLEAAAGVEQLVAINQRLRANLARFVHPDNITAEGMVID